STDTMLCEAALACALGIVIYLLVFPKKEDTLPMEDGWWGEGQRPPVGEEDESVRPFRVQTSQEELDDLFRRIDQTRFTVPLEDSRFHYGFNAAYLRKVVSYWRNRFDWQKQVELLNRFPHFKTKIEGLDIHFVHVKPPSLPAGHSAKPLMMVHGWPGSFFEFYKIIPLLTDPTSHGLSDEHTFEVICPSIPGYGFSEASRKPGLNSVSAARIFYKLMLRLGFREFYVQGGDWGWLICTNMAQMVPSHVKGVHLNFVSVPMGGLLQLLSLLLGHYFPRLFGFQDEDVKRLFPFMERGIYNMLKETGYLHIQATKPDSAGKAVPGDPCGILPTYILTEIHFYTERLVLFFFLSKDYILFQKFSLDELLTIVMLYWVTGTIVSSMRFYKENLGKGIGNQKHEKILVRVPTGIACFPNELMHTPKLWAKQKYVNIVSYNYMPRGGHFAAFEEPQLVADDIRHFTLELVKFIQRETALESSLY
uniref:Epoxide hydrolase n=1 Tax=Latimeria chalumnae TaxID=7897 RepID=H3AB84_LATCH